MSKKYDLIAVTSMGLRMTPANHAPVGMEKTYTLQATSAESNVLNVSASLGLRTKALTAFVEGCPMSAFIKGELRRRNIEYEGRDVPQGGPWGYRHQINMADTGYGVRAPHVWNDRAGEVGAQTSASDFDLDTLFDVDGVRCLHMSGLFAAISESTSKCCVELARRAKKSGTLVSFDLNYRESFWKNRQKELREAFTEIASLSDILIGNEVDYQLALGIEGPAVNSSLDESSFRDMLAEVRKRFPNTKVYATTLRQVINANTHRWGALLCRDGDFYVAASREIPVLDRIGGGDGFVGGLLYGLLNGWDSEKCLQFGWATGALAVTTLEDYATPSDEKQVWSIWNGNARVVR